MIDSKNQYSTIEDKFNKFKKDIQNERMFSFKINQLITDEYEEVFEDILLLSERQFFSLLKNQVESELEQIYSEKIFSEKKYTNFLEKGINSVKTDYKEDYDLLNNAYNIYSKNKNSKKNEVEFLTNGFRRHCIKEVENEHATHSCNAQLGKFLLVKSNNKVESVICINCKKVYYYNMILCKCFKCNKEYYTEILPKTDDEFLLPATWENYHCKQISNEKIKCIKCHEDLYINLKTGMLNCLNKKCNFTSKPTKILWTCSICQEDFKCGAIPYNPLDLEIIKKVIKQTLYQGQRAHPSKVPCCKTNVFFTEFNHKKKCSGVLYTGELNGDIIVVCDKCHAINFYERFVWTCPKCGNKFRDGEDNEKESNTKENSSENIENAYKTITNEGGRKKSNKNLDNNILPKPPNTSRNKMIFVGKFKKGFLSNRTGEYNTTDNENIKKNNEKSEELNKKEYEKISSTIEQPYTSKKIYTSRVNKANPKLEINNEKDNEINNNKEEDNKLQKGFKQLSKNRFTRKRFFTECNDTRQNEKEEKNDKKLDENQKVRKIQRPVFSGFSKLRQKREKEEKEKEEKEKEEKEKKEKEEKEEKLKKDKEEKNETVRRYSLNNKKIVPYRSFKRNIERKEEIAEFSSTKGLEKVSKNSNKKSPINQSPKKSPFFKSPKKSGFYKSPKELDLNKGKKSEEEEDKEEEDVEEKEDNTKNIKNDNKLNESPNKEKKEEAVPSFKQRWKFKHPETKKTLGKEIKEEEDLSNNSNNNSNKINNKSNENNNNNNSEKNDSHKSEKSNNNTSSNIVAFNPATKIPGMSENLLNHVNRRISNIISKCSIPLMNVEDYILYKKIGQGSYGVIFSVISKKDKKQYSLKKIISNKLKQIGEFIKEFELVYSCKHENIMKIYSFCIRILDPTTYALYVLMELSECDWDKEIKQKLIQRKNYSENELINILYQLSSALLYIQEKYHISHRDIKPQNVLVYEGGKYKLADFGEAKEAKVSRQINTLRGTELYMSPALYNGLKNEKNDVTHNPFKSDVFSLGFCFLYASALNFNLLYEVRDLMDTKRINVILHKFLSKCYSEKLIQLFVNMLEIDESKRFDFNEIKKYIEEKFPEMIKNE